MELDSSSRSGVSGAYPNFSYSYSLELDQQDMAEASDFDVDIFGTKLHVPWSKVEAAQRNFQDQVGLTAVQKSLQGEFDVASCGSQMHSTLQAPVVAMKDKFRSETMEDKATSDPSTREAPSSPAKEDEDLSEDDDESYDAQDEGQDGGHLSKMARTFSKLNKKTKKALKKTWASLERDAEMCNVTDMLEFQDEMRLKAEDFLGLIREDDDASQDRMIPHQDTATSWGLATLQEPSKKGGFFEHLFGQGSEAEKKTVIIELPDDFGKEDNRVREKKRAAYHQVKVYKTPEIEAGGNGEEPRAKRNPEGTHSKALRRAEVEEAKALRRAEVEEAKARDRLKKATAKHTRRTKEPKAKGTGENEDLNRSRKSMEGKTGKSVKSEPEGFRDAGDDEVSVEKGNSDTLQESPRSIYDLAKAEELESQSSSVWSKFKKLSQKKKQIASTMFGDCIDEREQKVVKPEVAKEEGKELNELQGSEEHPIVLEDLEESTSMQVEKVLAPTSDMPKEGSKEDEPKATPKQAVYGESQEQLTILIREYLKWSSDSAVDEQTRNQTKEQLMKTLQEHMKAQKHQSDHAQESRDGLEERITREMSDSRETAISTTNNAKSKLLADPNKNGKINMHQRPLTPEEQRDKEYWKKTRQELEGQRDGHLWLMHDSRYSATEDISPPRPPPSNPRNSSVLSGPNDEDVKTFNVHAKNELSSQPKNCKKEDATIPSSDPKQKVPFNEYKHLTLDSKEKRGSSLKEELANLRQQQAALFAEGRETFRRHTRTRRVKPSPERFIRAGEVQSS